MAQQLGLFGYPLGHSISPTFQQAALDHYSVPATYAAWPTPPESLRDEVEKLRQEEYLGANLTIPHKETVMGMLDEVDSSAADIGAVNTVVKRDGRMIGYNTDAYGLVRSLKDEAGFDPRGKAVVLLGAGGAARAAAYGLAKEGAASLTIANRTEERARSLAEDMRPHLRATAAVGLDQAALSQVCANADLIVNATPMGMRGGPAEDESPLRSALIPQSALVYDMVYTPAVTHLMKEAVLAGAQTLGGLAMLVYQGAASFELWTGKAAPVGVMMSAAEDALAARAAG